MKYKASIILILVSIALAYLAAYANGCLSDTWYGPVTNFLAALGSIATASLAAGLTITDFK